MKLLTSFTLWVTRKCWVASAASRHISRSPSVSSFAVAPGCGTQSVVSEELPMQNAKLNAGTLIGMLPLTPAGLNSQDC